MEAVRTDMFEVKYNPLQPYLEIRSIAKHCRPWQQMLMFFVRTWKAHEWKSPSYRLTRRQDAAFRQLIAIAEASADSDGSDGDGDGDDGDSESSHDPKANDNIEAAWREPMTDNERACLAFCIELLNQRIHNREYNMALVSPPSFTASSGYCRRSAYLGLAHCIYSNVSFKTSSL